MALSESGVKLSIHRPGSPPRLRLPSLEDASTPRCCSTSRCFGFLRCRYRAMIVYLRLVPGLSFQLPLHRFRHPRRPQCLSTGSSHIWCDIFHSPFACFRRTFKNMPLCDALVVLPFCTVVHATSSVPHTYAISPSPPILCRVTTSFVIRVGGASGGNQYSFSPFCPTRGVSPCGGSNTQ